MNQALIEVPFQVALRSADIESLRRHGELPLNVSNASIAPCKV
jgi:hypothetical protein